MSSSTQSIPENAEDAELEGSPAGVHSSLTVGAPVDRVWQHLISARDTEALLGPGVTLGNKGESWHSSDGPHGVVRSYHPLEQIRVSWHPDDLGWVIAALNLAGSIFFGLSAVGAYVVPSTGELLNSAVANAGTFLGAIGFLVGAALLIPEASQMETSGEGAAIVNVS